MPIYEYQCGECKQIFEEWQKDFKERKHTCPVCGGEAERLISNTSFVLKGSGWYVTDYKGANASHGQPNNNGAGSAKSSEAGSSKSEGTSSASSGSTPASSSE
jgi:putative FmdB family regulatory protein